MSAPLYEALLRHRALGRSPFHTPGHRNSPAALPYDLFSLDYTELPDTDSLYDASGPILEAEKLAAAQFGTARTCLSAGGCTLCIQAMLRLALPQGGKVLCSRVVHRSAVNAMALLGLEPVWALPQELSAVLASATDVGAVYVTSPNYYGQLLNLAPLAAECRRKGIPLLADSAHGAHLLAAAPELHPLSQGASMTADSAHKTLGVLTGGAWLNIADDRYAEDAKSAMALFGSTSPSYPVMASLDLARAWMAEHPGAFRPVTEQVAALRKLAVSRGMTLPAGPCDPARLTVCTASSGISGTQAAERMRRAGVEPEYADRSFAVFIATPFNTERDFLRLRCALETMPLPGKPLPLLPELPPLPPAVCGLREAMLAPSESVPLESAGGRTAAEAACPCPPGVPILMPGECVTKDAAEFLRRYGFLRVKVLK